MNARQKPIASGRDSASLWFLVLYLSLSQWTVASKKSFVGNNNFLRQS